MEPLLNFDQLTSLCALLLVVWLGHRCQRYAGGEVQVDLGEALAEPRCLGRYRLLARLGAGSSALVYKAVPEDEPHRVCAVKVLRQGDEEFEARLAREIQLWHRLNHPGVVSLLSWGNHGDQHYLVMELVEGTTLKRRMLPGRLPLGAAARHLVDLANALRYAHSRGVVHRDIKPENLMVTPSGQVKITDFGLALGRQCTRLTRTGWSLGTPAYMAPEQITGAASANPDPAIDRYAVGVVAYELLTGRLPFQGNPAEVMRKHLSNVPEEPQLLRPELPRELSDLVMGLLEKEADKRPTLLELTRALDGLCDLEEAASDRSLALQPA